MPLYEYTCPDCGANFDQLRSFSQADAPIACPHCGKAEAKRKLSHCVCHNESGSVTHTSHHCGSCSGGSCANCH
ncbi:MAG: zinc ribbon domain-containing protein [Chloroflexi bacterium]|nr:zinc ribbon domain-containing protein [Chloroflexota bacterium]